MNIIELEDIVKGLPDDRLFQEAQSPSGQIPQFLTISEIQRRTDMRERFKAQQGEQAEGTIADQVMQKGIASVQQPQGMQPQGMYQGGIVRMAEGGYLQQMREESLWERMKRNMETLRSARLPTGVLDFGDPNWPRPPGSHDPQVQGRSSAQVQGTGSGRPEIEEVSVSAVRAPDYGSTTPPGSTGGGIMSLFGGGGDSLNKLYALLGETDVSVPDYTDAIAKIEAMGPRVQEHYANLAEAQRDSYQGSEDLIEDQNKDAWAQAMIQLGAGIAGDDMSGGLQKAGILGLHGKEKARALELQDRAGRQQNEALARQLESQGFLGGMGVESDVIDLQMQQAGARSAAENQEFSRKVQILSGAAQIEAQQAYNLAQLMVQQGIGANERLKFFGDRIKEVVANDMTTLDPQGKIALVQELMKSFMASDPELSGMIPEGALGADGETAWDSIPD